MVFMLFKDATQYTKLDMRICTLLLHINEGFFSTVLHSQLPIQYCRKYKLE